MKTLEEYMNDPSVAHLQMPLREVKAIRLMMYDEQKNMTPEERRKHYEQVKRKSQEEFGFKYANST